MSLARLWHDQGKEQVPELLAPVYGRFTEGFDTWRRPLTIQPSYCEGDWTTGGGGRAGDWAGDEFAGAFGGLRGWSEVVCTNIFFLISCSAACIAAMFWAICSCLAASCSKLCRIAARSCAMGSSCVNSEVVAAAAGDAA
jgi:hypothetical protein